jgi:DUF1680 family protein
MPVQGYKTGTGKAVLNPLTSESCNTYNMLKLTGFLFQGEWQTKLPQTEVVEK